MTKVETIKPKKKYSQKNFFLHCLKLNYLNQQMNKLKKMIKLKKNSFKKNHT